MSELLEQRINDLEVRIAYQDDTIEQLDSHVQKLNDALRVVELYCRKLEQTMQRLAEQGVGVGGEVDETPPHY